MRLLNAKETLGGITNYQWSGLWLLTNKIQQSNKQNNLALRQEDIIGAGATVWY